MRIIKYLKNNSQSIIEFTLSLLLAAINFNLLLKPINLVAGGAGGLSIILSNFFNISVSNLITIIYIITFLLSLFFLDKKTIRSIIYASILYPVFVNLTDNISSVIMLKYNDILLISIISGIISGISNGLSYRNNYASGGISVFAPIFNKYFKTSISSVNFIINAVIVLLGGYFYGINLVLYAIILLYISSYVSNIIILGVSRNKMIFIKSCESNKIIEYLRNKYKITVTFLENDDNVSSFFVVIDKRYYVTIKNELFLIDKDVFFVTENCYEVGK